jgi:ATP-dependent DNA helicase RecQ
MAPQGKIGSRAKINMNSGTLNSQVSVSLEDLPKEDAPKTQEEVLHKLFGLTSLREKQAESIALTMAGKHTLNLLPTGYGKSLCYQLPSQMLPGLTLVISPLIALMEDQISGLRRRGINNATFINSTIDAEEIDDRIEGMLSGRYKLVYIAPERLDSPRFISLLQRLDVALLVIDEAHCISQWGHDFRPHYRHLKSLLPLVPRAVVMALTATATNKVQSDIISNLGLDMTVVKGDFNRSNLVLEVEKCDNPDDKDRHLIARLKQTLEIDHGTAINFNKTEPGSAIIYAATRKEAEALSRRITAAGIKAAYYHAGMPLPMRKAMQKRFEEDQVKVIVCTNAFGMGVDKASIRRVIHYNMPSTLENYYQEAGRAGRDGNHAVCTLLYQSKDIYTQRWLTNNKYPSDKQVFEVYDFLKANKNTSHSRETILANVEIKDSPLISTLDLFNQLSMIAMDQGRVKLIKEISWLDTDILKRRKELDSDRLEKMIAYALSRTCLRRNILGYFGQTLNGDCTGCDICSPARGNKNNGQKAEKPFTLGKNAFGALGKAVERKSFVDTSPKGVNRGENLHAAIMALVGELKGQVGRTTIAAILSGSKSKKITEKGFDKLKLYGACSHRRQETILETIDEMIEEGHLRVIPGLYPKITLA